MKIAFKSNAPETQIKPIDRPILTPEGTNYVEVVQSHIKEIDPKKISEEGEPAEIVYYCRQCKKMIEKPERIAKTLRFKCRDCGQERVAFGGKDSVQNYYRLKEGRKEAKNLMENL